jgi:hypothetical protein
VLADETKEAGINSIPFEDFGFLTGKAASLGKRSPTFRMNVVHEEWTTDPLK